MGASTRLRKEVSALERREIIGRARLVKDLEEDEVANEGIAPYHITSTITYTVVGTPTHSAVTEMSPYVTGVTWIPW